MAKSSSGYTEQRRARGSWDDVCVQDTVYSLFHGSQTKIQDQTYLKAHKSEVREHLTSIERSIPFTALDLDNDDSIDKQVDSECLVDVATAIAKRDNTLLLNVMATSAEFIGE
jgi:hypothetical protein